MASKLDWRGPAAQAWIRAGMAPRVATCCLLVANRAKLLINVDGTAKTVTRDGSGRHRKGRLRYGVSPSKPGEPPHKQTGRLLGSVAWESDGLVGRVGTNVLYGRWLELGTRLMAARPWLRRALAELRDRIKSILSAPMKGP